MRKGNQSPRRWELETFFSLVDCAERYAVLRFRDEYNRAALLESLAYAKKCAEDCKRKAN